MTPDGVSNGFEPFLGQDPETLPSRSLVLLDFTLPHRHSVDEVKHDPGQIRRLRAPLALHPAILPDQCDSTSSPPFDLRREPEADPPPGSWKLLKIAGVSLPEEHEISL